MQEVFHLRTFSHSYYTIEKHHTTHRGLTVTVRIIRWAFHLSSETSNISINRLKLEHSTGWVLLNP